MNPPTDAFFDNAEPAADSDSVAESQALQSRRQAAGVILAIIHAHNSSPRSAGIRSYVLAHALRMGTCRTQRDLARKLGVSPGRISQILKLIVRQLGL